MSQDTRLGAKIKGQIRHFAGELTRGWTKPKRRLVGEMLYGIQASEDVKLSNISRALNERIALRKTENRLSRQLAGADLSDRINRWLCWAGAGAVDEDTVLAVDVGDLTKPYGRKMDYLATVRDGSAKTLAQGYWLCQMVAAHPYGETVTPLYGELYSPLAPDFVSENAQVLKAVRMVTAATGRRGIVTIDRGGDRRKIILPLLDERQRFIVRQDGDRHVVLPGGEKHTVAAAARWAPTTTVRTITVEHEGHRQSRELHLGEVAVRLPERPEVPLWLVVIRGRGAEPILLLTNVPPAGGRDHASWIADCYLTRWRCEEAYRFVKQSYHLEDVRVRGYAALRNIYALVQAVFYFVSVVLGRRTKLNLIFRQVCAKAQRFYEIATFFHYAVADGIHRLLWGARGRATPPPEPPDSGQLLLAFARPPG